MPTRPPDLRAPGPRPRRGRRPDRAGGTLAAGALLGVVALAAIHVLLAGTYWDYSEGVYALSARLLLHGGSLYSGIAAAQPPGVFLAGAVLLGVHDSLEFLRAGIAALQLVAGVIAARTVLELTGSRIAAALTVPAMILTPWAVREHGALLPELVALPCLLAGTRLAVDPRRPRAAGVVLGLLPLIKLPLALPALALLAVAVARRRTAAWALGTVLVGLAAATALAGPSVWRDTVLAQAESGTRGFATVAGYWVQGAWNLAGLIALALLAVALRARARRPELLRASVAAGLALALMLLGTLKQGTSLDTLVPLEAALVPLAACGAALAAGARGRSAALVTALAVGFTLVQSVSLIGSPRHPVPFLRPASRPAWAVVLTRAEVRAAVGQARRCPPGRPYSGPPWLAFRAERPMPGGQPDQFLIGHAPALASLRARIAAAGPRCP